MGKRVSAPFASHLRAHASSEVPLVDACIVLLEHALDVACACNVASSCRGARCHSKQRRQVRARCPRGGAQRGACELMPVRLRVRRLLQRLQDRHGSLVLPSFHG